MLFTFEESGIVHPNINIFSSFTHPQVVPNLYEFLFFSAEHNGIYFEEYVTKQLMSPTDFQYGGKH